MGLEKRRQESPDFLIIMKRKFLVLVCFVIASLIIFHLLTNDDKTDGNYRKPPAMKRSADHQHTRREKREPIVYNIALDQKLREKIETEVEIATKLPEKRMDHLVGENREESHDGEIPNDDDIDVDDDDTPDNDGIESSSNIRDEEQNDGSEDKLHKSGTKESEGRDQLDDNGAESMERFGLHNTTNSNKFVTALDGRFVTHFDDIKPRTRDSTATISKRKGKPKKPIGSQNGRARTERSFLSSSSTSYNCPYEGLGVRRHGKVVVEKPACIPYKRTGKDCNGTFKFYERFDLTSTPIKCEQDEESICVIKTQHRLGPDDHVVVKCNPDICEDEVLVGCRDEHYGIVPDDKEWQSFDSIERVEVELPNIIKKNSRHGFNFCFLKCANGNERPLIFPPLLKTAGSVGRGPGINVNIIVEDALSRAHFYRSLPRTVSALRKLTKNPRVTVLDFELVQSYASFTLTNLRALFTGTKLLSKGTEVKNRDNGVDEMMKKYQRKGYQTLVQEDMCFFDTWGSVLSGNYKDKLKPFTDKFRKRFQKYSKCTKRFVDNIGLTQFACEALRALGYTNPYRHLDKVCSNGRFVSEYLLEYVERFLSGTEREKNIAPAIVYTHLNTAHEKTGERIRVDDVALENHVKAVSGLQNTITVIVSDHGSKTTDYSINTFHGRLEVFSPLMFMIIPEKVAETLGQETIDNLIANQNRLVSFIDLHNMLNTILTIPDAPATKSFQFSGVLAPIPLNRTCGDLEGLSSEVYCRCKGWNHFVNAKSHQVHWLAEIALGEINNRITNQFTKSRVKSNSLSGYGACARFVGKSVERARQEIAGNFKITSLLLLVEPAYGVNSTERFEVKLNHSTGNQPNVQVMDIIRVSVYGKYESCADHDVDVKLCACAKPAKTAGPKSRPDLRALISKGHFGVKTSVRRLSSRCLLFGKRTLKVKAIHRMQPRVIAFEVANRCRKKSFRLKIGGTSRQSLISRKLPFTLRVKPRSIVFLYAVDNKWNYGKFRPLVMLTEE